MPTSERIAACAQAAAALAAALSSEIQPVPDGWFSRQMLQESEGMTRDRAKDAIRQMKARGLVEEKRWKTPAGTVPIYHLKST
jgi:hypothetical protein